MSTYEKRALLLIFMHNCPLEERYNTVLKASASMMYHLARENIPQKHTLQTFFVNGTYLMKMLGILQHWLSSYVSCFPLYDRLQTPCSEYSTSSFYIYMEKKRSYTLHVTILKKYLTILQIRCHGEQKIMTTP